MNWKTTLTTLLVAALPLGAIAATPAQPSSTAEPAKTAPGATGKEMAPPLFMELDKNHDNYLSQDEVKRSAEVSARFAKLDADHDGKVSLHEYLQGKLP